MNKRFLKKTIWLLLPLGLIHLAVIWLRNFFYDLKMLHSRSLPRSVISVGNIQMGGTGKTPFVLNLLERISQNQRKVAVLTRGYKRESRENRVLTIEKFQTFQRLADIGDEPALILQNLKDGVLGIGADRYTVGQEVLQQHPADIFLLDDGFQHRQLRRDLDICLIDVSRWPPHPFLFPFSTLRDSKSSLRRAHIIILTKFEQIPAKADALKSRLQKKYKAPVLKGEFIFESLKRLSDGRLIDLQEIRSPKAAAMCGIANPQNFLDMLKRRGFEVVYSKIFADHHRYQLPEVREAQEKARQAGADCIIVTEKDAVKMMEVLSEQPDLAQYIWVLTISFRIDDESELMKMIDDIDA